MHVLKYAQYMSTYTISQDLLFPSRERVSSEAPWSGYRNWAVSLARRGRHWEAINVVKILASAQKIDWSIEAYEEIFKIIATHTSTYIDLSRAALLVALGRRLSAKSTLNEAMQCTDEAQRLLSTVEDQLSRRCWRQRIELDIADLELQSAALDVHTSLQRWHDISISAQERLEWGIESLCLTQCAQIAATNGMNAQLYEHATRLEIVEQELERDIQSVLTNRCNLWRAGDRQRTAELLRWFDDHEDRHPLSGFLTGEPKDGDMQRWDIPLSSVRMAQLRYIMYSALWDMERAKSNQSIATQIIKHVPWFRVVEMGLADRYVIEWFNPLSVKLFTPFEVLSRRIKIRYSDLTANDGSDWYRYRELDPAELQNIILSFPFNQLQFESRVAALQHWFDNDDTLDRSSSHYLVASLYLEHYAYAKLTGQDLQVKENIVTQFGNFVRNLPESSRAVQRYVEGNVLLALQELYDMKLKNPSIDFVQLQNLRQLYQNLIAQYEESHLATNLPTVGSLYGRIAEIDFRLAFSEVELQQAMQTLNQALVYHDNFRTSFSVLKELPAMEIKASIRQGPVGDREILHRAISALMTKWQMRGISDDIKVCIASLVWDIVQKTKNRALNDALSSGNILSAGDRATVRANASSAECLKSWHDALKTLCLTLQAQDPKASEIAQARETIRIQEQKMLADPLCAKVIALSKGAPPSTSDMSKLFLGSKDRVILVDWFTADVPVAQDKLLMVTIQICPEPQTPQIHNLELGIARKIFDWNIKYLKERNATVNRKSQVAYDELKQLAGLVQPLAEISQPNDILVFCPTTKWNLHRIPLHAIEMCPSKTIAGQQQSTAENLPMLRNLIVYTYSQSLLRLSVASRQSELPHGIWKATILSPLAYNLGAEEAARLSTLNISPVQNMAPTETESKDITQKVSKLSKFLSTPNNTSTPITSKAVIKSSCIRVMPQTSFFTFLGHVHLAPQPINSHLLLYHPLSNIPCTGSSETDPETFLSGRDIITRARLEQGAHVVLLACGSGVTEARVQDEALGLVPAFFHAGASSVVATLWDVQVEAACTWLQAVQHAWESAERKLRKEERAKGDVVHKMINLAGLFRSAARTLINRDGRLGIDSWAPFVYSGYWMYPRVKVEVWDSDEEDV